MSTGQKVPRWLFVLLTALLPQGYMPALQDDGRFTVTLCTGDGLCEEIAPDVFVMLDDGLAYVKEGDKIFAEAKGNPQGAEGLAEIPDNQLEAVIESAEECPGECIMIEPYDQAAIDNRGA